MKNSRMTSNQKRKSLSTEKTERFQFKLMRRKNTL